MPSVFTRIIAGELPATFIHHDEVCVTFLSINPLARGHVLVVPRLEIDQWTDLPDDVGDHLFDVARRIARAQKTTFECRRVGLIIAGFEVPHCHVHVVPTESMDDLSFDNAAPTVESSALEETATILRRVVGDHGLTPWSRSVAD